MDGTRDSLSATLGFAGLPEGAMADSSRARLAALRDQREVRLTIGTALWADSGATLSPRFVTLARDAYHATAEVVELQSAVGAGRVDAWAARETEGRIPRILDGPQPPETAVIITNAVYFKGRWADEFDVARTRDRTFRGAAGDVSVPMMRRTGTFGHHVSAGVLVARLPYRGNRLAMYVLLPDSAHTVADAVRALTPGLLRAAAAAPGRELALEMPRLTLHASASLRPALEAMGAEIAFVPGARLSRLFAAPPPRSWISRVEQGVFLEVNEEGTEAAAVTTVEVSADTMAAMPLPFVVDRPFVFAIRDDRTGEVLFAGRVASPKP